MLQSILNALGKEGEYGIELSMREHPWMIDKSLPFEEKELPPGEVLMHRIRMKALWDAHDKAAEAFFKREPIKTKQTEFWEDVPIPDDSEMY